MIEKVDQLLPRDPQAIIDLHRTIFQNLTTNRFATDCSTKLPSYFCHLTLAMVKRLHPGDYLQSSE